MNVWLVGFLLTSAIIKARTTKHMLPSGHKNTAATYHLACHLHFGLWSIETRLRSSRCSHKGTHWRIQGAFIAALTKDPKWPVYPLPRQRSTGDNF